MISKLEETALITRCIAFDDRRAFGRLVDAYSPGLRRFLLHLAGDPDLADDIAQEAFIKAYQGIKSFQGLARFKTWLYRIAYREFYSNVRSAHPTEGLEGVPEPPVSESMGDRIEASYDVEAALQKLPAIERTLMLLFYLEDRPIKEIVDITGLPSGTVKSYLSRARGRMAKFLNNGR